MSTSMPHALNTEQEMTIVGQVKACTTLSKREVDAVDEKGGRRISSQ